MKERETIRQNQRGFAPLGESDWFPQGETARKPNIQVQLKFGDRNFINIVKYSSVIITMWSLFVCSPSGHLVKTPEGRLLAFLSVPALVLWFSPDSGLSCLSSGTQTSYCLINGGEAIYNSQHERNPVPPRNPWQSD